MKAFRFLTTVVLIFLLALSQSHSEEILFHDDFDEGALSPNWQWLDPRDDSILTFSRPGWLEIKATSGNDLQPESNMNAPRLLYAKTVNGDFAIETSISAPKDGKFQSGGLLIWKDANHFLRFERGTWGADTAILQKREQGVFAHVADLFFEKDPTYLRIERRKDNYRAMLSEDGKDWREACSFDFQAGDPLRIGIHAVCMGLDLPPTVTDFDYFKLSRIGDETPYTRQSKTLSEKEAKEKQNSEAEKLLSRAREVLSKTASERQAKNKDIVTDPETGVRFKKKLVDERFDVVRNPYGVSLSPDGRFLYNATEYWVVPTEKGEPFKLLSEFHGDVLGGWSPDMKMFAFFNVAQSSLWVIPVSPDTSRPTGPPKRIVEKIFRAGKGRMGVRWSPDSKWIPFSSDREGNTDIWIASADGRELTRLTDDPLPEVEPRWSPDGKSIVYFKRRPNASEYEMWSIPAKGGSPEKLASTEPFSGVSCSPDGKWLGFRRRKRTEKGMIEEVALLRLSDMREFGLAIPEDVEKPVSWSPDSKQVIFFKTGYDWKSSLRLVNAYGGPWVELGKDQGLVAYEQIWTSDGERIITDGNTDCWWIIPTKGGSPVRLELNPEPKPRKFTFPSFSPDLTKSAYLTEDGILWVFPISIDQAKATGKPVEVGRKLVTKGPCSVSWSPDSKWVAFPCKTDGGMQICIGSTKGEKTRRLVELPGERKDFRGGISWSPDSRHIAYEDKDGIWVIPSSGGEPGHMLESEEIEDHAWSPDGKEIAFIEKSYISVVNVQTGEVRQIVDLKANNLGGENSWDLKWSPDGSRLAFISFRKPRYRAFVVSASGGDLRELAEDDPGDKYYLAWSPDGKKVSYNSDSYFKVRTGALWTMDVAELVSKME